jgi:hypothetical protein
MPDWKSLVSHRLKHVWPDGHADTEVIDELTAHLQDRYDEVRAAGRNESEAIDATLSEMIDSEQFDVGREKRKRQARRASVFNLSPGRHALVDFSRDLRYGARLIVRNPGSRPRSC